MIDKPTFFLCHGAMHSGEAFGSLKGVLEEKSYPCVISANAPSLSSDDALTKDLATDVAFTRKQILPLLGDGRYMVVVLHSYAGVYGGGAVQGLTVRERQKEGLKGGILGVIYMTAICLPVGMSCLGDFQTRGIDLSPWTTVDMEKGVIIATSAELTIPQFYNQLPADEANKWANKLLPQSLAALTSNAEFAPFTDESWKGMCAYLLCENDQMLVLDVQKSYADGGNFEIVRSLPASHSVFLDMPTKTAEVLIEMVDLFPRSF